jgi:hypothetical protein
MLKKVLLLLLLALPATALLESCVRSEFDDCGPFDIKPISIERIDMRWELQGYAQVYDSVTYPLSRVVFRVHVADYRALALLAAGFFPAALACSPPEPMSAERVTEISISSPDTIITGSWPDTTWLLPGTELRQLFTMRHLYDGERSAGNWEEVAIRQPHLSGTYNVLSFTSNGTAMWRASRRFQLRLDLDDGRRLETSVVDLDAR